MLYISIISAIYYQVIFHYLTKPQFLICLPVSRHLDCFQIWAITNSCYQQSRTTVSMDICFAFFLGITGSYVYFFNFLSVFLFFNIFYLFKYSFPPFASTTPHKKVFLSKLKKSTHFHVSLSKSHTIRSKSAIKLVKKTPGKRLEIRGECESTNNELQLTGTEPSLRIRHLLHKFYHNFAVCFI